MSAQPVSPGHSPALPGSDGLGGLVPQAHTDSHERTSSGPGGLAAMTGTVHLVIPAAAWLGLTDAAGEAAGLGPLDAWACGDLAARLAAGGEATRWRFA